MNRQQRRALEKQNRQGRSSSLLYDVLNQAIKTHQEGNLAAAEKMYRSVLRSIPNQPDACHYLGVLFHQCGRSGEAIASINRAIMVSPNYTDAYNNLGNVYKETGDLEKATNAYRKVIELSPNHSAALNNWGVVLKDLGEYAEAIAVIQKAIELEPTKADYFQNLGNVFRLQGDLKKSAEACRQSIALQPYQADAYIGLWSTLYLDCDFDEAAKVLLQWLAFDPENAIAKHTYAAFKGGELVPERASDDYVQQTFDDFAGSFDQVLKRLDYRAPDLVAQAVSRVYPTPCKDLAVLDAGCGTGLCGPLLSPYAASLVGVDLSPKMLAKAEGRGVYDELTAAELVRYLGQRPVNFDLIVSADTLVYFGELGTFIQAAKNALRPGGHLVFTLEKGDCDEGFKLNIHGRYSHKQEYVESLIISSGMQITAIENEKLRNEGGVPVLGILVTAGLIL